MALGPNSEEGALYSLVTNLVTNFSPNLVTNLLNFGKVVSNCNGVKKEDFMKNFHKMVTPPPCCICEILIQIFTVNELVYNRIYEI